MLPVSPLSLLDSLPDASPQLPSVITSASVLLSMSLLEILLVILCLYILTKYYLILAGCDVLLFLALLSDLHMHNIFITFLNQARAGLVS